MKNLYLFAIGGSGERVMSSLVMLLTAGVHIEADNIIPVFVDNDEKSFALDECRKLLKAYSDSETGLHGIYAKSLGSDSKDWPSFGKAKILDPLVLNVSGASIGCLEKVISCPPIDNNTAESDKMRIESILREQELLFSEEDMQMPLNVGFVGNPNIGSVVLKSISFRCQDFDTIVKNISPSDGVMVIGSLFGGTGAAGFPLIVNTFNGYNDSAIASNKPILGGIALLPYFNVGAPVADEDIDHTKYSVKSDTFDTKTRAALMYYDKYMGGMDCLYYVGDDAKVAYDYSVGGKTQKNPVHIVELLSAMSIVDFAKNGRHNSQIEYRQPLWNFTDKNASSSNVTCVMNKDIRRAFVRFKILEELFKNEDLLKESIVQARPYVHDINFTDAVRRSVIGTGSNYEFAKGLCELMKAWDAWLKDLSDTVRNKRSFGLFKDQFLYDVDTIFTGFYGDTDFGIAQTELKRFKRVTVAKDSELLDALKDAFNKLSSDRVRNVTEAGILSTELLIISKALDDIIDKKTTI